MKTATLGELFTDGDLKKAQRIIKEAGDGSAGVARLEAEIVVPRMDHINRVTKQENLPRYFAYALLYAVSQTV